MIKRAILYTRIRNNIRVKDIESSTDRKITLKETLAIGKLLLTIRDRIVLMLVKTNLNEIVFCFTENYVVESTTTVRWCGSFGPEDQYGETSKQTFSIGHFTLDQSGQRKKDDISEEEFEGSTRYSYTMESRVNLNKLKTFICSLTRKTAGSKIRELIELESGSNL